MGRADFAAFSRAHEEVLVLAARPVDPREWSTAQRGAYHGRLKNSNEYYYHLNRLWETAVGRRLVGRSKSHLCYCTLPAFPPASGPGT